jgi:hypothetical protein
MATHTVQDGEDMVTIAQQYGFAQWEVIYYHAENAKLRAKRPNPFVLFKGDEVVIPAMRILERYCETGKKHTFRLPKTTEPKTSIDLVFEDDDGIPYAGRRYELVVEGTTYPGKTSPQGHVTEKLPVTAKEGQIKVWLSDEPDAEPEVWDVQLGQIEPVDTPEGQQGRLVNLGYLADDERTDQDAFVAALTQFQEDNLLPVTSEADSATRKALVSVHGS